MFREHLHLSVTVVDHSQEMLSRLNGVTDPEAKRKAIGDEFIKAFKNFSDELDKKHGIKPAYLVQVPWLRRSESQTSMERKLLTLPQFIGFKM